MKRLLIPFSVLLFAVYSTICLGASASDFNRAIVRIGTQNGHAYISVNPVQSLGDGCIFSVLYVGDLSTPAGKAYYATLLTAYSEGKPLSRVDYQTGVPGYLSNQCIITLVEIQ